MKGFIPSITIYNTFRIVNVWTTITVTHSCGILLLAQAHPKMPCIYTTSLDYVNRFKQGELSETPTQAAIARSDPVNLVMYGRSSQNCGFTSHLDFNLVFTT